MCLDCGCGKPNDDHGDKRHLTMDHVRTAARASEIDEREAQQNIIKALQDTMNESKTRAAAD